MRDALKNYLALASGVTEVGRQRAVAASKALVAQGEATAEQVGSLAEDLVETSRQNRSLITSMVRSEIEKALTRVGLATADEVQRLTRRLQTVESALREASGSATPASAPTAAGKKTAARKPAARKPAARKPAARKATKVTMSPAKKTTTRKAAATKATARKTAARKTNARKATTRKTTTRKATTRKATARKATS